jgi:hypothetical protein
MEKKILADEWNVKSQESWSSGPVTEERQKEGFSHAVMFHFLFRVYSTNSVWKHSFRSSYTVCSISCTHVLYRSIKNQGIMAGVGWGNSVNRVLASVKHSVNWKCVIGLES